MIRECQDRVFASYRSGNISRTQTPLRNSLNSSPAVRNSASAQEATPSFDAETAVPKSPEQTEFSDSGYLSNSSAVGAPPSPPPLQTSPSNDSTTMDASTGFSVTKETLPTSREHGFNSGSFDGPSFDNSSLDCNFSELQVIDWNSFMNDDPTTSFL
jgi:hypothetical protein